MSDDCNPITGAIVDSALRIHRELGPGLLESVYELVLSDELVRRGHKVARQTPVPIVFGDRRFTEGFRADLLVDQKVIIEVKSVENLAPVHFKQLLTYLRLMDLRVGLLLNFGAPTLIEGLRRVVNRAHPRPDPGVG